MINVRLAGDHLYGKLLFTWLSLLMSLCCPFPHEMSWMRSGTYLSQFLRVFLLTFIKRHKLSERTLHVKNF